MTATPIYLSTSSTDARYLRMNNYYQHNERRHKFHHSKSLIATSSWYSEEGKYDASLNIINMWCLKSTNYNYLIEISTRQITEKLLSSIAKGSIFSKPRIFKWLSWGQYSRKCSIESFSVSILINFSTFKFGAET